LVLEEETTYDFLGRVTRATLPYGLSLPVMVALTMTDTGDQLQAGFSYDGQGRLQMVAYPQVPGVNPLVVRREYDTYGNLVTVRDNADGTRYWQLRGAR
jgi:hypothetical protein